MARQVVVLGNHRTGSSCVAGVLSKLGVSMGYDLLGAHGSNPVGHYEDKEFLLMQDTLIGKWTNPKTHFEGKELQEIQENYSKMIERRDKDFPIWGVKDPRLCIMLPYFWDMLSDPVLIEVTRHGVSSTNSLQLRERWTFEQAWEAFSKYEEAKQSTIRKIVKKGIIPHFLIRFEDLVEKPNTWVGALADFAFADLSEEVRPSNFKLLLAERHINPDYVHVR
jgi:hypothetical protein